MVLLQRGSHRCWYPRITQSPDNIYKETKRAFRVRFLPSTTRVVYSLIAARKNNVLRRESTKKRSVQKNDHFSIGYTRFCRFFVHAGASTHSWGAFLRYVGTDQRCSRLRATTTAAPPTSNVVSLSLLVQIYAITFRRFLN
jgi:hypothetical protein